MKKGVSILMAVVLVFACALLPVGASGGVLWSDDFSDLAENWVGNGGQEGVYADGAVHAAVIEQTADGTLCIPPQTITSDWNVGVCHTFSQAFTEDVTLRFTYRRDEGANPGMKLYLYDPAGKLITKIRFGWYAEPAYVYVDDGPTQYTAIAAGVPHDVQLVLHPAQQTFELFVDGVRQGSEPFVFGADAQAGFGGIAFESGSDQSNGYISDLVIRKQVFTGLAIAGPERILVPAFGTMLSNPYTIRALDADGEEILSYRPAAEDITVVDAGGTAFPFELTGNQLRLCGITAAHAGKVLTLTAKQGDVVQTKEITLSQGTAFAEAWTDSFSYGSDAELKAAWVPEADNAELKLVDGRMQIPGQEVAGGAWNLAVRHTLAQPLVGDVLVSFTHLADMVPPAAAGDLVVELQDGAGTTIVRFRLNYWEQKGLWYFDGENWWEIMNANGIDGVLAKLDGRIGIVAHTADKTYDLYMNGVKVTGEPISFLNRDAAQNTVGAIRFESGRNQGADFISDVYAGSRSTVVEVNETEQGCTATVTSNADAGVLILAVYEGGVLKCVRVNAFDSEQPGTVTADDLGDSYKIFVWDGLDTMVPLPYMLLSQ